MTNSLSGSTVTNTTKIDSIIPDGCTVEDSKKISDKINSKKSPEVSNISEVPNTHEVPNIKVEFFKKVNNRAEHRPVELDKILTWATSDTKELKRNTNKYKKFLEDNPKATTKQKNCQKLISFPALTFGGTFGGTGKSEELLEMSGLIVLDFDHLERLEEVRQKLENDISTHLLFVSPSGDGLKVIIKHNLRDVSKWQYLYQELEEYYFQKYDLSTDKTGKDISRMCYIPFIEKLYRKDDCQIWNYSGKFEKQAEALKNYSENGNGTCNKTEVTDELYRECFYMSVFLKNKNINLAESYDEWVSYGFSLCTFGEEGREIYNNVCSVSDKYDEDVNNDKYTDLLDNFNGDRSGINKYLVKAKEAIANHVNQELKNEITLPPDELYDKLPTMLIAPLMKYHNVTKFMALIACIGNVSGILPSLKFVNYGTYEYQANLYAWIVAQQASGKDVVNKMQKIFSTIESKMKKEYDFHYAKYKEREEEAKLSGTTFNETKPVRKSLYLGADITKAGFVQGLVRNSGRAIISTTEAQTLISSNYTTYGAFLDLILACYGHERYEKTLKDFTYNIPETYLSLILAATPESTCKFFANSNVDNGLLSRFFAFLIVANNDLNDIPDNVLNGNIDELLETTKVNFYQLWVECKKLEQPVYLDITEEIRKNVFEQYRQFENDVKYVYKFNHDVVKRMQVMHKRLLLIFSALYHYEKHYRFDLDYLNDRMPEGWIYNTKIPVDPRAIEFADTIMSSYREAFVRLMFGIEQQKYRKLSISARNDKILQLKLKGHSPAYLAMLFDLPQVMIDAQMIDKRVKVNEEQKNELLEYCKTHPHKKDREEMAKIAGVSIRTIYNWCKTANITVEEDNLVQ
jgi:hypothetical protein